MNIDCMKELLKKSLSEERYLHSEGTARCAVMLAKKYGLDEQKAYIAGLLHDCAKCFSNEELLKIINETLKIADECEFENYKTLHAPVGSYTVQAAYGVLDKEIIDAIACHTIGKLNMSLFEKIIFVADKIETNTRDKEYCDKILAIMDSEGMDSALLELFGQTLKSLVNRRLKICKTTIDVYNELLDKVKNI